MIMWSYETALAAALLWLESTAALQPPPVSLTGEASMWNLDRTEASKGQVLGRVSSLFPHQPLNRQVGTSH